MNAKAKVVITSDELSGELKQGQKVICVSKSLRNSKSFANRFGIIARLVELGDPALIEVLEVPHPNCALSSASVVPKVGDKIFQALADLSAWTATEAEDELEHKESQERLKQHEDDEREEEDRKHKST